MTEYHDQGLREEAIAAGGVRIQMFEVIRSGFPPAPIRQLSPQDGHLLVHYVFLP